MPLPDPPEINMSSIKVAGVGGLGMVALVFFIALELQPVRWFVGLALVGGALLGLAFVGYRRWVRPEPPHGPTLMVEAPTSQTGHADPAKPDLTAKLAPVASAR